jgi:hypothetical protein
VTTRQLEFDLWDQLHQAQQIPEAIDLVQMLDAVEAAAAQLPEAQRLRFAGDALLQMAELCAARSGVLMTQWEESSRDPIVEQGFFADMVWQTMAVDLSDLMEPAPIRKRRTKSLDVPQGSIAAPVEKAAVLAMVDQLEAEDKELQQQNVLAIAHSEDMAQWVAVIDHWLQAMPIEQIHFIDLCQGLGLTRVEVWLGLLFGKFELQQLGEFYGDAVWIKRA